MRLYLCMVSLTICNALRHMFAPNSRFLELSLWGMELETIKGVMHKRKMRRCHDALFDCLTL
jgi:hypothetical protein